MINIIQSPWPWYVAGPLIGLIVPILLLLGNRQFGVSANLRHMCAAVLPAGIPFFKYDWKTESWNLFFAAGMLLGGVVAMSLLADPDPLLIHPALATELATYGINKPTGLLPAELFSFGSLGTLRGLILLVGGGFLVGFGTRYAGGCTSGHAIMGISTLQLPSLVATICFMAGGFLMANLILPLIMKL